MTSSRNHAPIALFVYNRPGLTRQTLDALARNEGAAESDLVIFSDGPKSHVDAALVAEVRSLLTVVKGFRSVRLVKAEANRGLAPSIITGITATINQSDRVIVVEDDIVTSPHFLNFMNDALELYSNSEKVGSISGYTIPVDISLPETFFSPDESCWGWATWKRAWAKFEPDGSKLLAEIQRTKRTREFDLDDSYPFGQMLKDQIAGRNSSWAIRWRASLFLNRMLSLYPRKSLIRNIGTDGSGTHAGKSDDFFDTIPHPDPIIVSNIPVVEEKSFSQAMRAFYHKHICYGLRHRALRKFKRILAQL